MLEHLNQCKQIEKLLQEFTMFMKCFFPSVSLVYCCSTFGDIHWSTHKLVCQVKQEKN